MSRRQEKGCNGFAPDFSQISPSQLPDSRRSMKAAAWQYQTHVHHPPPRHFTCTHPSSLACALLCILMY
jgi:hypothetical protein